MKPLFATCLSFLIYTTAFSQQFETTLKRYADDYRAERIYLHYDKSTYSAGDTIWFKGYMVSGVLPATGSKTLYIDWTDGDGNLFKRTSYPVINGITYGQLEVPADWTSSFIHARAYTKWMLNFDSSFLYNKDIRILSGKKNAVAPTAPVPVLSIFPEGGQLVSGMINKVAFKANDQYGRPVKISGQLLENGKVVTDLNVSHDGMGYFFINPKSNGNYVVEWKDEKGKKYNTAFPEVLSSGVNMQIGFLPERRTFLINASADMENAEIHLVGTMYQQPVFDISRNFKNGIVQGVIPVQVLPSGILTITVLDKNYHPLAERITFINNNEYRENPEVKVAHWGLNRRARNELEIEVPDSIVTNMSVSVTDLGIDYDSSNTVISALLLSEEIKGKVYNPSYYFNPQNDSSEKYLDLVMLTHGWRKISWQQIAAGHLPEINYPRDTTYETISGKIYGATPVQLQNMGNLVLIISRDKKADVRDIVPVDVNPDGTFNTGKLLFDTARIFYQMPKKGRGNVQFMQNKLPSVLGNVKAGNEFYSFAADTSGLARHRLLANELALQSEKYNAKVLETVTITAKAKDPKKELDNKYTSGFFSGSSGSSFDVMNDKAAFSFPSVLDYIRGKVAGLTITPGDPPELKWRMGTPALFLNEFPITADALVNIPMADIAYVKTFSPPFMGAVGGGAGGAIAVYTRKGGEQNYSNEPSLPSSTVNGYTTIRQFYSPDYLLTNDDKKDLRTTLYWNPEVITTPTDKKVLLTWYNNDISHAFRVVIEGMTEDGRFVHVVKVME